MEPIRFIEFFDPTHFERHYEKLAPPAELSHLIAFFCETRFLQPDAALPRQFHCTLFPNTGYHALVNLGGSVRMHQHGQDFDITTEGFAPLHTGIEYSFGADAHVFGIQFHLSPALLDEKANFVNARLLNQAQGYRFDAALVAQLRQAGSFAERAQLAGDYFKKQAEQSGKQLQPLHIVNSIADHYRHHNDFKTPIENWAGEYGISTRTLQRYFEMGMGVSSKKVLQLLRIRRAVAQIAKAPESFHFSQYHYYDNSHFYKHLKQFLNKNTLSHLKPHLKMLQHLRSVPRLQHTA
jgi:AraC-like DNA-binding protein